MDGPQIRFALGDVLITSLVNDGLEEIELTVGHNSKGG